MTKTLILFTLLLSFLFDIYGQDSTNVTFQTLPLDSALVYIEADNYIFTDTLWVKNGETKKYRSGFVIFTLTSNSFRDTKDYAILKPNETRIVKLDSSLTFNNRKQNWNSSSFISLARNANVAVFTEDESNVYVNGKKVGNGPLLLKLPENASYSIKTKGIYGSKSSTVKLHNYNRFQGLDHFTIPSTRTLKLNAAVPGTFDIQRQNYVKGFIQLASIAGLTALIISEMNDYVYNNRNAGIWATEYQVSRSTETALEAAKKHENFRDAANINVRNQRIFIGGITSVFVFNYIRMNRLQKKRIGNPSKVDFLSLPRFEYDSETRTFMGGISKSF